MSAHDLPGDRRRGNAEGAGLRPGPAGPLPGASGPEAPLPPRHRRGKGFTLIELLVAMALMTILTGSVVFIFIESQEIFTTVDARVQVYQYVRYAFDQMERDLANVVKSSNMEFFNDYPPPTGNPGRFDQGEEIPITGKDNPPAAATMYHYAFTMRSREPYTRFDPTLKTDVTYARDSIYFKTVIEELGGTTTALVEYALADTDQERPRLVKRVWRVTGVDNSNPLVPRYEVNNGEQVKDRDLCLYAVEARFELMARTRRRHQAPLFYDTQGFLDPPAYGNLPRAFDRTRNWLPSPDKMMQTFYDERHDPDSVMPDLGEFHPAENGLFRTQRFFTFPMLREGDQIFISGGGLVGKLYTIKAFVRPDGTPFTVTDPNDQFRIQLEEKIEWPSASAGQVLQVKYQAAWLPPALRATVKVKDGKSKEVRTAQRVFKILSSSN